MPALKSNNGKTEFALDVLAPTSYAHDCGFDCNVRLSGGHWDGDHVHDTSVSIGSLWLREEDLLEMHDCISRWVSQSLRQLAGSELTGEFILTRLPGQKLIIRFGFREDTISDLNQVVTLDFAAGALQGEIHFVTDQSCLRQFLDELKSCLSPGAT